MDGLGTTRHHFQHLLHDDNRNDTGDNQDYEQQHYDGDWSFASGISHLVKDDFLVEDILDLTCILEDSLDQQQPLNFGELEDEEKVGDDDEDGYHSSKYKSSSRLPIDDINPSGPAVPVGDIFDLEWLSQIVDDSIVDLVDLPSSAIISPSHLLLSTTNIYKPRSSGSISNLKPTFTSFSDEALLVPSKSRSKRARKGGHAWSIPHRHMAEPLCSSSVSSSSSCSSTFSLSSCLLFDPKTQNSESILLHVVSPKGRGRGRPPLHKKKDNAETQQKQKQQKKKKKKGRKSKSLITTSEFSEAGILGDGGTNSLRRCSHCGVQKTPQWRAGPKGAKTLCNACGVRYKSGRLLPEYRPAISPTFLDHVHSNSHRKVLEMRRMKELEQQQFLISDSYSSTSTTGAVPLAYSPAAALPSQQQMVF